MVAASSTDSRREIGVRGYYDNKDDIQARLRRIEGQVRGVQRMVDEDKYCIDILTQITAIDSALKKVAVGLLEDHIGHCVAEGAGPKGGSSRDMVAEASAAIGRLVRV